MLWYTIFQQLQEYIKKVVPNTIIGALEPSDYANEGVVFLIRDREYLTTVKNMHSDNIVNQELYIENWVRDDTTDVNNGYQKIANQERLVFQAIQDWLTETDLTILSADILETISDGDTKRPLIGSRTTLKLTYSMNEV